MSSKRRRRCEKRQGSCLSQCSRSRMGHTHTSGAAHLRCPLRRRNELHTCRGRVTREVCVLRLEEGICTGCGPCDWKATGEEGCCLGLATMQ